MKKIVLILLNFIFAAQSFAQDSLGVDSTPATGMRSHEKIYVVVAVVCTILAALFIYLIRLDRKISRMEKSG